MNEYRLPNLAIQQLQHAIHVAVDLRGEVLPCDSKTPVSPHLNLSTIAFAAHVGRRMGREQL